MRWLLLALLGLGIGIGEAAGAEPGTGGVVALRLEQIDERKAVFATVETIRRTQARTRIGGTVASLSVSEGDQVQAGQDIAAIGDPKLAMQIDANDQRSRAQQAQRDLAQAELRRTQELFSGGTATRARLDQAQAALQIAERNLAALQAERAVAVQQLAEGAVLAPATGRVLAVPVSPGSVVLPGETIAVIATENYILRAEIPERHARFVKTGDSVLVGEIEAEEPLGMQGKTLFRHTGQPGRIVKIYPELREGRVIVDIAVAGLDGYFVGERVRVWVSTGQRAGLAVPRAAVRLRHGLNFVTLADGREILVQPGRMIDAARLEILAGLRPGDQIVVPQ